MTFTGSYVPVQGLKTSVRVNTLNGSKFEGKVGVIQGSPWELLYADDFVLIDDSMEGVADKF